MMGRRTLNWYFNLVGALLALVLGSAPVGQGALAQSEEALIPGLTPEEEEIAIFILGNVAFTLHHELGHALVTELDLPIVGREEDAVDGYAAVMMIAEEPDPMSDALIVAAADGWALVADAMAEQGQEMAFWDDHGLDEQRFFASICHLVGSDPDGFYELAVQSGLPEARIDTCPRDYDQMFDGWSRLLAPHLAGEGRAPEGRVLVAYQEPAGESGALRDLVRDSGLVEAIAGETAALVVLPRDLTLRFSACDGDPNAYWDPDQAVIQVCYELLAEFGDLIAEDIRRNPN